MHDVLSEVTRREALRRIAVGAAVLTIGGCRQLGATGTKTSEGRISARPHPPTKTVSAGLQPMGLDNARDALLYVPKSYRADVPAPLALLLHGAGQAADELIEPMQPLADETGMILVAPNSREASWDIRYGAFGADVVFINTMLERVFDEVRIASSRISVCGFSDGASYALSIGLANGDLFGHILAMSPGFMVNRNPVGKPKIFITHGTSDQILSIDRTSRVLVPQLKTAGYDVEYHEFDGRHQVSRSLLRDAVTWMLKS
jgi:phospholipase/carboxylesterase